MINIIQNTIGALGRVLGIVRKNLQLWFDFTKSEVIGSELQVNDFSTNTTGWGSTAATISVNNDELINVSNGSAAYGIASFSSAFDNGKTYIIEGDYRNIDAINAYVAFHDGAAQSNITPLNSSTSNSHFKVTVTTASTGSAQLKLNSTSSIGENLSVAFSNISVKEVTQFVMDKSPNTNNATLFTGKALSFNGNDEVSLGSQSFAGSDITIAVWSNLTNLTGIKPILGFSRMLLRVDGDDINWYSDVNAPTITTFVAAATTSPQRLVLTQTGTEVKLYIDGILFDTRTLGVIGTNALNSFIGAYNYSANHYEGILSDLQIYNKVWTASDVAFDYNNPNHLAIDNPATSLVVTDLKAYWALSEGDGLVAYDSGSTLEEDVVQNGDFSELGSEEVTDGIFSNGLDDWNQNGNFTSVNNQLICNTSDAGLLLYQNPITPYIDGKAYEYTFDVVSITTGNVRARLGNTLSDAISTEGTHSVVIIHSGTTPTYFVNYGSDAVIDNISVKQVDPNDDWVLGTGWSYGDDKVVAVSGSGAHMTQDIGAEIGKQYQVNFDVEVAGGKVFLYCGQYAPTWETITESNSYSFNLTWGNNNPISFYKDSDFVGSITNISVTEITQSAHGSNVTPTSGDLIGATYVDKQPTIPQLGMMDWAKGSNLITYSEDFAEWSVFDDVSTVANYGVSPDGTQNSFKVSSLGGVNDFIYLSLSITASQTFTVSFFIKNIDSVTSVFYNPSESQIEIDWNGATISSINTGANYESVGNGWYKITSTSISNADSSYVTRFYPSKSPNAGSIELFGYQLEESSSAGNYILTDGAAAIDVTTIQNPTNKGYDILGNALRLRENAFNLDGSGYAEIADSDSLDFGTGDFTVECWATYKFENTGSGLNVIISNGLASAASTLGFNLLTNSADFVIRLGDGSNVYNMSITATPIENTWYYIAFTRVGTTLTVYLDDADGVDYTDADIAVDVTTANPITVGVDAQSSRRYKGLIDEPRLYNRALTSKEIINNYKIGLRTHS